MNIYIIWKKEVVNLVFEKRMDIRNPELLKRIYELRNEGSGFNNITKVISTEFNIEITHPTAKNLYYEYAAKQNIKKQTGEETDKDFEKILNDKFERIEKITSSLLDAVETIKDGMDAEMYLKHAPTIISILRESLNQLAFIRNEQQQIMIKQQNVIFSPIQIISEMNRIEKEKAKEKEKLYILGEQSSPVESEVKTMCDDEDEE